MSPGEPVTVRSRAADRYPLTRTQSLIWASQRLHPDVPLANMGKLHRIRGPLEAERLVAAFARVVQACDALRTVDADECLAYFRSCGYATHDC